MVSPSFFRQKTDDLFSHRRLTTPTLLAFQVIVSPVPFLQFSRQKYRLSSGCHPLDGVTQDGPPPPPSRSHSLVTPLFILHFVFYLLSNS